MAIICLSSSSLSLRPHRCPYAAHYTSFSCFRRASVAYPSRPLSNKTVLRRTVGAVSEEETLASQAETLTTVEQTPSAEQITNVPVSPSDLLTMFFKAEGTMDDSAISKLSKALEVKDGVSDLKVQNLEGIASVELAQQTTVQATGVASNLVEIIQSAGFKLQTLYLSFEDKEDGI
ncbi:uncharacterized protein LOC110023233 [Phalaenopsis equestris]|uniref:uncharacterized protein LOC110023233 n=1 Tax=Phalaenopsis equestris TaxID=78828 RepID=UPI0009E396DF|nr:uncharacterized protein LOC110023233 [Phalaenopsis equestris]